jgi:hypothetical protein
MGVRFGVAALAVGATLALGAGVASTQGSGGGGGGETVAQPAHENARAARPAERVAIRAAALTALSPASRPRYRVVGIRVSTRSSHWATASLIPRPRFRNALPSGGVILVRSALNNRWTPLDLGTDAIGCGIAPTSVLRDFGWASTCPPAGRA